MPQFTLICTDEDQTVTTKEFDATMLQEVVEKTQDFLKGVGYCFEELGVQVYPVPKVTKMKNFVVFTTVLTTNLYIYNCSSSFLFSYKLNNGQDISARWQ